LICSRSHFYRLIRNPIYCGLILIRFKSEESQIVKGTHEPLITEPLFYEVQRIITTKRKVTAKRDDLKAMFFLRGFLQCPLCGHKLSGSFSKGTRKKYPYYHCHGGCKTRINAIFLNDRYQSKLQQLVLLNKVNDLFSCILEDRSIKTQEAGYLFKRNLVDRKLKEEGLLLSRARKLFMAEILKLDDYNELKRENQLNSKCLKKELLHINAKLRDIEKQNHLEDRSFLNIFQGFSDLDTADKRHLVNLIPPVNVDYQTGNLSLGLNDALSKKSNRKSNKNEFH
jgi:site-specific DNA recombinase